MKKYKELFFRLVPILVVVILTIGLSEVFYRHMIESETDKCWDEMSTAHQEASGKVSDILNANVTMLDFSSAAIVSYVDFKNEEVVCEYLKSIQKKTIFDRIDIVFPDGTILLQDGEWVADNGEKTYEELLKEGTHFSQRVPDFYTGNESIHIFSPVYDAEGESVAILGATIHCTTLGDLFYSAHFGDDAQLFLVDLRDGDIVMDKKLGCFLNIAEMERTDTTSEYRDSDYIADIMTGNTGRVSFAEEESDRHSYMAYGIVEGTNYTLGIVVDEDIFLSDVNKEKDLLMQVGIVEVILLIVFATWLYCTLKKSSQNESRARQAEYELLQQKEKELERQYEAVTSRQEFLETMAINLPGGYHRCTTDHSFKVSFVSNSFVQITGYTLEQLQSEFAGSYMGIVAPEDREYFMSLAPQLERDGYIQCAYRMRRRDGSIRWVQDSTQFVERDGEQYYQCALTDVTEQIEALERARQEAEASSQAKSTFLFNISHDIRTPMNAIKGFSHIIEQNAENAELVRSTVDKIQQASDSLMLLMNDVLDISRIERGKEEINLQPMNLREHGKNLYEMFAADMQAAGIQFEVDGEDLDDNVYCDHLKLTRIMMNMLSNAKKFTPKGGVVTFGGTRLRRDEQVCTYRFFVRDTGVGMSPEFLERAFEQFERERTSTESGVSGSGLGLAIIKMLVELMGGTVDIQSELGRGTEIAVTLTLPYAEQGSANLHAENKQIPLDFSGKKVLLVEDNEFNREIARYVLESVNLTVEEVVNGMVCIEKLLDAEPGTYDLILMDIQMPVMDGYTATLEIRNMADREIAEIPIIAMTANAFDEDKQRCIEVGMNGHIGKPIDRKVLLNVIADLI